MAGSLGLGALGLAGGLGGEGEGEATPQDRIQRVKLLVQFRTERVRSMK